MVAIFYAIMYFYQRKISLTNAAPVLVLLYVYIFLGTVEITMNNNFWLFILVLFMLACSDQKAAETAAFKIHFTPRKTKRRSRLLD